MRYTIEFEDLFDWEKESDLHYYMMMMNHENVEEREISVKPIIINHEVNPESRKVRRSVKEKLLLRSHLLTKALRTKSRL